METAAAGVTPQVKAWGMSKEAAEILGCCVMTVERYKRQGILRTRRVPGMVTRVSLVDARRLASEEYQAERPDIA